MATPIQAPAQVGPPTEIPGNSYTVRRGDTLADIAKQAYGDPHAWTEIWAANEDRIKDPFELTAGQKLVIPQLTPPAEDPTQDVEPVPLVPQPQDQVAVTAPKADPRMAESVLPPAPPAEAPRPVITVPEVVIVAEPPAPPKKTYAEKTVDDMKQIGHGAKDYAIGTVKTPYHLGSAALETAVGATEGAFGLLKAGATLITRGKADTDLLMEGNESLRNAGNHVVGMVKAQGQALKGVGTVIAGAAKASVHTVGTSIEGWASLLGLGVGLVGKVTKDSTIGDSYRKGVEMGRGGR